MFKRILATIALVLAATATFRSEPARAQVGAKDRPLNVGLIGGMILDRDSLPIANATVSLSRVIADVSECSLRLYGPGARMNRSVTTSPNGVFLIAFEWEPEQVGCLLGGAAPRGVVNIQVFDAKRDYRTTSSVVPLLLAPNLAAIFGGVGLKATGPVGEQLNKRIDDATKNNPALKAYLRSLSQTMTVEMYGLMGDAGAIVAARP